MLLSRRNGRGGLAVVDQAVFAGSHFAMNLLLARWMAAEEYGVFTVVYAVFLVAAAVHTGLVIEPAVVHGSGRYRPTLWEYLRLATTVHWRLSFLLGLVVVAAGFVLWTGDGQGTGAAMIAIGVATPSVLYLWLVRKAAYIPGAIHVAVLGGIGYGAALLSGLVGLRIVGLLTPVAVLLLMGIVALPAGLGIRRCLGRSLGGAKVQGGEVNVGVVGAGAESPAKYRHAALRDGFRYGRWATGVHILMWLTSNAFYVVVGGLVSVQAAGSMRAVMNVFLPIQHVVIGVAGAMLPAMSRRFASGGASAVRREGWMMAGLMVPAALLYAMLVAFAGDWLLDLAYAGRYNEQSHLLTLALPLPLLWVGVSLLGNALRAVERPNDVFWGYGVSGIAIFVAAVPLIGLYGVEAAILAWGGSLLTSFLVMLLFFSRLTRRQDEPPRRNRSA